MNHECYMNHWSQRRPYDQLLFCIGVPGGIPFRWNLLIFGCLEQGWAVVSQPSPTRAIDPMVEGPRWRSLLRRKFRKVRFSRTNSDLSAQSAHRVPRSEEHTSELQSRFDLVCRLLLGTQQQHN